MKLFAKMLLMLLVAVMGMSVQSCSKEETKIVNSQVAYGRGDGSTIYYGDKSLSTIIYLSSANPQTVTEAEAAAVLALNSAVTAADQELQSYGAMTDSQAIKIYQNALKSFVSGKGYSGYLPIYRYDEGKEENKTEIGRITFSE